MDSLPPELLDFIIDSIDSRIDILSLAGTCQFFKSILIPLVYDYREITVPYHSLLIWNWFNNNSTLLRHVRKLRLNHNLRQLKVPRLLSGMDPTNIVSLERLEASGRSFLSAMSHMRGLVTLCWDVDWRMNHFDFGGDVRPVLPILHASCPRLREISIWDSPEGVHEFLGDGGTRHKTISVLRNIETFHYHFLISLESPLPIPHIIEFVIHNPSLQVFTLNFHHTSISHYEKLADIFLPHLRTFVIIAPYVSSDVLSAFITRNRTIECLTLDARSQNGLASLTEGSLPSLRQFTSHIGSAWTFVCLTKPPLSHLGGLMTHDFTDLGQCRKALRAVSGTLKVITVPSSHFRIGMWVQEILPHVEVVET
ncbi:hypothetical protein JAAARDRAFT_212074 [Jaapia argillacea MUCL 33604]|uniref:F-box domain-containing protein n=1 Tax=Jaapia argillacea MUCL 33604 TaxID=933084 RepID=A0A067PF75_9AGAM|nr:hypothetical protein JAAARDRAFT_212074 [Jaapia argillacea MUCL 33604]